MRLVIISVTANGAKISKEIKNALNDNHDITYYSFEKYPVENAVLFSDMQELVNDIFNSYDGLIFVCACAIAVRKIAPLLRSKLTDPAVITVDEMGNYSIPILSGHIGGANALAELISEKLGAIPVITTATDIGEKFSPDSFAKANHLFISDMDMAKKIAVEVLNGSQIGFYSDFECKNIPNDFINKGNERYGICISDSEKTKPFENTLNLIPKNISIGFGCKRNTDSKKFEEFILKNLQSNDISISLLRFAATIDLKKDEKAIYDFGYKYRIPIRFYSAEQLMSVTGEFSSSDFVSKITGTDNVCERAAAMDNGRIIVTKTSKDGMTFAAALNNADIDFERRIL